MAGVPFIFGNATTSIPLSNLDADFNTGLTIGNTTVGLGNTVTTLGNVTLTNVNIVSGTVPASTSIANGTSNVSISSSGGNINVVTGGTIATFPQSTGTVMVSGNMPAFSAYSNATQTFSNITYTKVALQVEEFDTANAFDSTTNYRFTPLVAGYYQINGGIQFNATICRSGQALIYKSGSAYKLGTYSVQPTTTDAATQNATVSSIVYLNGSTDYVEFYGWSQSLSGAITTTSGLSTVWFNGSLVRSA